MTFVSRTQFHFERPGQCPSRGLLRDYTTGCGTDGSICGTNLDDGLEHHHDAVPPQSDRAHLRAELQLDHDLLLEVVPDGDLVRGVAGAQAAAHHRDVVTSGHRRGLHRAWRVELFKNSH